MINVRFLTPDADVEICEHSQRNAIHAAARGENDLFEVDFAWGSRIGELAR